VSSLELLPEAPLSKPHAKVIPLAPGLFLQVGYCEKNRPPIIEVDFLAQPTHDWILLKAPHALTEKLGGHALCYKAGDCSACEPLTDIELLITERKRGNDEKEVFILPPGFKIVGNNPLSQGYLIYKRSKAETM
jgi:hypothetical protein